MQPRAVGIVVRRKRERLARWSNCQLNWPWSVQSTIGTGPVNRQQRERVEKGYCSAQSSSCCTSRLVSIYNVSFMVTLRMLPCRVSTTLQKEMVPSICRRCRQLPSHQDHQGQYHAFKCIDSAPSLISTTQRRPISQAPKQPGMGASAFIHHRHCGVRVPPPTRPHQAQWHGLRFSPQ